MTLNAYAAEKRLAIFDDLRANLPPREGAFDEAVLAEAKIKGQAQMGTTRYEPDAIYVEFIYPDPATTSTILTVKLDPPERIVFLPVPGWVTEQIWQGEISGSHHFESGARQLVAEFGLELDAEANKKWFGPQMAKRRE